jgi:hypothetical protein
MFVCTFRFNSEKPIAALICDTYLHFMPGRNTQGKRSFHERNAAVHQARLSSTISLSFFLLGRPPPPLAASAAFFQWKFP